MIIFIEYDREKLCIRADGTVRSVAPDSNTDEPVAYFSNSSTVNDKIVTGRYFHRDKSAGLYYCEDIIPTRNTRSLLHALGIREGMVGGIYFEGRILALAWHNGAVKMRFTGQDYEDPTMFDMPGLVSEWSMPYGTPVTIYGINAPMGDLFGRIGSLPPLQDYEQKMRKAKQMQMLASVSMIVVTLASYLGLLGWDKAMQEDLAQLKDTIAKERRVLQKETFARLPLYLKSLNIPLDGVLQELSFLEGASYQAISVSVNKQSITGTVTTHKALDAYKISEVAPDVKIASKGGVIEIGFDRQAKTVPALSGGRDYSKLFTF